MPNVSLIVTIVDKGRGEAVLESSRKAGAGGGTVLLGRGTGIHEKQKLLGIPIEPEKEIVFTVVNSEKSEEVLQEILRGTDLCKPGMGIAFVVPIEKVVGVSHDICEPPR